MKKIVEELCGMDVSSTQVSRAAAELDERLTARRERDLGPYRRRLRTTSRLSSGTNHLVEPLNEEIRRRARVARRFPNEASCLRLVSAVLMEIAENWQTAEKSYVTCGDQERAVEG